MENEYKAVSRNWEEELKVRCAEIAELKMINEELRTEKIRLCKEMEAMRKDLESLEAEAFRMRAQLDIVYLIFGKR